MIAKHVLLHHHCNGGRFFFMKHFAFLQDADLHINNHFGIDMFQ